eukprot:1157844-Pelagomonas_calceolata.AAC.4
MLLGSCKHSEQYNSTTIVDKVLLLCVAVARANNRKELTDWPPAAAIVAAPRSSLCVPLHGTATISLSLAFCV